MQLINLQQANQISGGIALQIQEFIPDTIPGCELIGWQQTLVGYDTTSWEEKGWFFTAYHVEKTPIFEFTPIYTQLY